MIQNSTGKGRTKNRPADVITLQLLLNDAGIATDNIDASFLISKNDTTGKTTPLAALKINGLAVSELSDRIEAYQKAKSMKVVDGWISPTGKTIKSLLVDAGVTTGTKRMEFLRKKLKSTLGIKAIKVLTVLNLYDKQYSALSSTNRTGLSDILTTAKSDTDLSQIAEFAYMLATTKHETAHTFRAIEEYGKGSGRSYGKEITVTDPKTKKTYKNKYYGRGYVQLTWGYNYQRIDQKLGHGNYPNRNKTKASDYNKGFTVSNATESVYLNPAKALNQKNAYVGLVWGMQKGIYTGKKIGDYVSTSKIDYYNARRVINGTDKASRIAGYAENLEILLLASTI